MEREKPSIEFYGGEFASLIPTVIYIVAAGIFALVFKFYSMQSITVGGIIGLLVGFFLCKDKKKYWDVVLDSFADKGNMNLILVFLIIGIFTTTLSKCNIGHGFIWISQKVGLSGGSFVIFAFLASAVIAMGCGAPITGLYAIVPIMYPPGLLLNAKPEVLLGALISGVFLGDNLSPSSQVSLMTTESQKYADGTSPNSVDLIKYRFKYVGIVALIACVLFYIANGSGKATEFSPEMINSFSDPKGLIMLIPLAVLLILSFRTGNLFLSLSYGILSAIVLGLASGLMGFSDLIAITDGHLEGILFDGVYDMVDVILSTMLLFGLIALMVEGGAITKLGSVFSKIDFVNTVTGTELVISLGMAIVNILLAGSALPAILLFSALADELGNRMSIDPVRRSFLLTTNAFHFSAIFPLSSSFIMGALVILTTLSQTYDYITVLSPFKIFAYCYYNLLLTALAVIVIVFKIGRRVDNTKVVKEEAK